MPRFDQINEEEMFNKNVGGGFHYSGTRVDKLGATQYTLATIAVDATGSVGGFATELKECLKTAVKACKRDTLSENMLVRSFTFSSGWGRGGNTEEIHGFKPLENIEPDSDYPDINCGGMTPLNDAVYDAVESTLDYADYLDDADYLSNCILFIITDGEENSSQMSAAQVKAKIDNIMQSESLESVRTVLIGINASQCAVALKQFKDEVGITEYVDVGDITKSDGTIDDRKLAKLADFISKSTSSTSQNLGTGAPSQSVPTSF